MNPSFRDLAQLSRDHPEQLKESGLWELTMAISGTFVSHINNADAAMSTPESEEGVNRFAASVISLMNGKKITSELGKKYTLFVTAQRSSFPEIKVFLKHQGYLSKNPVMMIRVSHDLSVSVDIYLRELIWDGRGKGPQDFRGQRLGPQLYQILGEALPLGAVVYGPITNRETQDYLGNKFYIKGENVYERDSGRVVTPKFDAEAVSSGEISIPEVMSNTYMGKLSSKYAGLRLESIGYHGAMNIDALKAIIEERGHPSEEFELDVTYRKTLGSKDNAMAALYGRRPVITPLELSRLATEMRGKSLTELSEDDLIKVMEVRGRFSKVKNIDMGDILKAQIVSPDIEIT